MVLIYEDESVMEAVNRKEVEVVGGSMVVHSPRETLNNK